MKRENFIKNLGVVSLIGLVNSISLFANPKTELETLNTKVKTREGLVRQKLDQLKRGNLGVAWTGLRVTQEEFDEGMSYFENYDSKGSTYSEEQRINAMNIFRNRQPQIKKLNESNRFS